MKNKSVYLVALMMSSILSPNAFDLFKVDMHEELADTETKLLIPPHITVSFQSFSALIPLDHLELKSTDDLPKLPPRSIVTGEFGQLILSSISKITGKKLDAFDGPFTVLTHGANEREYKIIDLGLSKARLIRDNPESGYRAYTESLVTIPLPPFEGVNLTLSAPITHLPNKITELRLLGNSFALNKAGVKRNSYLITRKSEFGKIFMQDLIRALDIFNVFDAPETDGLPKIKELNDRSIKPFAEQLDAAELIILKPAEFVAKLQELKVQDRKFQ